MWIGSGRCLTHVNILHKAPTAPRPLVASLLFVLPKVTSLETGNYLLREEIIDVTFGVEVLVDTGKSERDY